MIKTSPLRARGGKNGRFSLIKGATEESVITRALDGDTDEYIVRYFSFDDNNFTRGAGMSVMA